MKLSSIVIFGLLGTLLAGCVSSTVPSSAIGSGAFIRGVNRVAKTDFDAFYVDSIDGASVSMPAFRSSFEKPVPIGPGERVIVVHYEGMDRTLSKLAHRAEATVRAKIEAGITYIIDGRDEGDSVYFWISRADTGEKVTEETLALKTDFKLQAPPMIIPIFHWFLLPI